jgi:thiamine biosynthesis lipoprotein
VLLFIAAICLDLGIRHGLVDLGGDIRIIGPHPDGQPWLIAIRNPRDTESAIVQIALEGGALATSGDYERYIEVDSQRYCHRAPLKTQWEGSLKEGVAKNNL